MDLVYDLLDELTGNTPANQQATEVSEEVSSEYRHRNVTPQQHASRPNLEEDKGKKFAIYQEDSAAESRPWHTQDSRQWESHSKDIQGEFSNASNPEQSFKIAKKFNLDSFPAKEGWLNIDDLDLKTSPSEYPPPSRAPPPLREAGSNPSTSGQTATEGEQQQGAKGKDKEQFLTKIIMKRTLSYELVEDDVYDDEPQPDGGGQPKQSEPDLIDISTLDLNGNVTEDKNASELSEKAEKKVGSVSKAIEEDLAVILGKTNIPTSNSNSKIDRKGKTVAASGSSAARQERSAVVAEMKERDLKRQREMEEVAKAADLFEAEFKRWSAGKEGNLRSLLSSLQNILGPEFGWQPIPITDLIESASVRKQYKRATLLVHPDKLQQKGATPRQKYIAEQVFGLLKEASKKFNSEELF